jgi:pSer/pThr/pTyr-binding forkhead associated (FHA) protein
MPDEVAAPPDGSAAVPRSGRSAGHLVVLEAGRSTSMVVQPGRRLLVGRDADAEIRVSDPSVSFRHATIERRGHEWVVQDVDAVNPTRLVDEWGTSRPVHGETAVTSARLEIGGVRIALYASRPEG